jgi:hypothetical protein
MKMLPLILLATLAGCSSIMNGGKQSVTVITDPQGAECNLTDSKGRVWYVENTPGTVLVRKGNSPISVICKKEGYESGVGEIKDGVTLETAGNIFFPPGFIIDGLTGSAHQYDSTVTIDMTPLNKKTGNAKKPWQ